MVPGCNKPGGHRFPADPGKCAEWVQAIKRLEKVEDNDGRVKLVKWKPKTGREIVCRDHFQPSDYRTPSHGSIGKVFLWLVLII